MTLPDDTGGVVRGFADAVRPVAGVCAFYVSGSLATGDFHTGVSDLDLVALIDEAVDPAREAHLVSLHRQWIRQEPLAGKLHCAYLVVDEAADVGASHLYWAHGECYRQPLTGVARAELLRHGVTVYGPPPAELIPPVSRDALVTAVRAELSGYWSRAVRKRRLWLQDLYVDLGLLTLPRVEATLSEDRLITKSEALSRLHGFGVEPSLVAEIGLRRQAHPVPVGPVQRLRRAEHARSVMRRGIDRLLQD